MTSKNKPYPHWVGVLFIGVLSNFIAQALSKRSSTVRITTQTQPDGSVVATVERS